MIIFENKKQYLIIFVCFIAAVAGFIYLQNSKGNSYLPFHEIIKDDLALWRDWKELKSEELGISIKVPAQIEAYHDIQSAGCALPLVFGKEYQSTVALMPKYASCDATALPLSDANYSPGNQTRKITVIPVKNESEISGFIKARITESAGYSSAVISAKDLSPVNCLLNSLTVKIPNEKDLEKNGTLPVSVLTDGNCRIDPDILTVRYSPKFKKAVFFEALDGVTQGGDYSLPCVNGKCPGEKYDQEIYRSLQVFK